MQGGIYSAGQAGELGDNRQDGNGDAHLKYGLVGSSEAIPWSTAGLACRAGRTSSAASSTGANGTIGSYYNYK